VPPVLDSLRQGVLVERKTKSTHSLFNAAPDLLGQVLLKRRHVLLLLQRVLSAMFHRDQGVELAQPQEALHHVIVAPVQGVDLVEVVNDVGELAMETSVERVSRLVMPVLASGAEDEKEVDEVVIGDVAGPQLEGFALVKDCQNGIGLLSVVLFFLLS
jgi:primosomal replication protein N